MVNETLLQSCACQLRLSMWLFHECECIAFDVKDLVFQVQRFKVNFGVSVNFGAVNLVFVAKTATFKFKRVFSRNVAFILLAEISISHGETSRA